MFAALVPDIHRVPAERGVEVFQVIARPSTYPPTWDYLPVCQCIIIIIIIIINFMIILPCQIRKNVCFGALALYDMCPYKFNRGSASSLSFAIFLNSTANIVKMAEKNHHLTI